MAHQLEIELKTPEQIGLMRRAGLVVADALERMRAVVAPGVSTADLDRIAEETIRAAGAVPSFKGYHGYPASICSSVNDQVVHAIPSPRQVLREGDLISIDCGADLDGWHGDAAITVAVGDVPSDVRGMVRVAEDAMWAGIAAAARGARSGKGRLTDISFAIQSSIRKAGRYGIVEGYGGHGIGTAMHQDPFVQNSGRPGKGPMLRPGIALAIEPMITRGKPRVAELDDGWTVVTVDGSVAVHVEHTMAICDDGVWVLTAHDGGRARLGDLITSREPVPAVE
ncbi:type I methionyl aminopeptidase [Dactylosporangium sp. CA-092794]|uniref:type I methionyl aminopeptidase n=1 Tax=Dactylosporangium sp. CA-092794 TaxID=3239929 RepID=UPI003D8AC673